MKTIFIILSSFVSSTLFAQLKQITLKECIESALSNKANIMLAKTEVVIANLKQIETKAKYLPEVSLAYDYRYNPLIASQVIPVGQFNQVPTNEKRAIQFGTNWQQNAGVTVYQPLLDLTLKSRIKESNINEKLSLSDLKKKETELKFEVLKTYNQIKTLDYERQAAVSDTMRSFISYSVIGSKFKEGKMLKTEINTALVNHNKNLSLLNNAISSLINEKIYLSFLTAIKLERLLDENFASIPAILFESFNQQGEAIFDSLTEFQRVNIKEELLKQQMKTENYKSKPTIGFQGFLGANQYSQKLNPIQANSWFGNSYVGLSLAFPILSKDKSINGNKQLQTQLMVLKYEKEELQSSVLKNLLQSNQEIERLKEALKIAEENVGLLQQNLKINQERFQNGKLTASELNLQEADLQKETIQINSIKQGLSKASIQVLYISGRLNETIRKL